MRGLAERRGITSSTQTRLENGANLRLSTLIESVEALGGSLTITLTHPTIDTSFTETYGAVLDNLDAVLDEKPHEFFFAGAQSICGTDRELIPAVTALLAGMTAPKYLRQGDRSWGADWLSGSRTPPVPQLQECQKERGSWRAAMRDSRSWLISDDAEQTASLMQRTIERFHVTPDSPQPALPDHGTSEQWEAIQAHPDGALYVTTLGYWPSLQALSAYGRWVSQGLPRLGDAVEQITATAQDNAAMDKFWTDTGLSLAPYPNETKDPFYGGLI